MTTDLTIQDLAAITGRHVETLRRLARMGRLPGVYRLGHCWMISRQAANRLRHLPDDTGGACEGGHDVE